MFDPAFEHQGLNLYRETGDMGALEDVSFQDWTWQVYRMRGPEEMIQNRVKSARVWMTKVTGPVDLSQIQRHLGGGDFEFWGYFGGHLRTRIRHEIDGPRKTYDGVTTRAEVTPAPAAAVATTTDDRILRLLEGQQRTLDAIAVNLARPATNRDSLSVTDVFSIADRISQRTASPENGLSTVVEAFKEGMALRANVEGGPEKSTTEVVIEKLSPLLERVLGAMLANRRPAPAPRPAAPAGTVVPAASRAEVLDDAGDPAPAADASEDGYRWRAAIEAMANAIAEGEDPADFAVTLERILNAQELGMLRLGSAEMVTETVRKNAGSRFEILNTDAAAAFVAAVLEELKRPTED
jgi:hypothetical protein